MTTQTKTPNNLETLVDAERIIIPPKIKQRELARILGVHPITIRRRMLKYGIKKCPDGLIRAADARRLIEE